MQECERNCYGCIILSDYSRSAVRFLVVATSGLAGCRESRQMVVLVTRPDFLLNLLLLITLYISCNRLILL
jgi:hypothetical protein